jgi:hypothetical protein
MYRDNFTFSFTLLVFFANLGNNSPLTNCGITFQVHIYVSDSCDSFERKTNMDTACVVHEKMIYFTYANRKCRFA